MLKRSELSWGVPDSVNEESSLISHIVSGVLAAVWRSARLSEYAQTFSDDPDSRGLL